MLIVSATRYARVVNDARRTDPFLPGAIGWMKGTLYVAYTNWECLEVRDEHDRVVFTFEPANAGSKWMLSNPLFTRNYLVLAKSSGEFNQGFWAWDWASRREILSESLHSDGRPFLCQPHGTDVLLAQDPDGIAVWDLESARRRRVIPCEGPNGAAVHTATRRIAYTTSGALHVVSEAGLPASQWSVFGDWDSLAWGLDGSVLIGVPVRRGALVIDPKSGATTHTFPVLGNVLAASPDGRWIALEKGLVDLQSMTVHEHARHVGGSGETRAACFDSATRQFAFVGRSLVWRVPV